MKRTRNTDRRSGDRLWDDQGRQWQRERTTGYYLTPDELAQARATSPAPRVALLADHAPLVWPDPQRARAVLGGTDTSFPGNGNGWAVTSWRPISGGQEVLLLIEEVH